MRTPCRTGLALAAAFWVSTATAQLNPTPKINEKGPEKLIPPTATPAPRGPVEFVPHGPKELPPTPTHAPTRTPTPTPVPPDVRPLGPTWGPTHSDVPIIVKRLDSPSQCKTTSFFQQSGKFLVMIDCYAQGYGPLGLRADVDIAKGIRLKNGWKVKGFTIFPYDGTQPPNPDSHHGFSVTRQPSAGSDDPSVSLRLFSEWGKGIQIIGDVQLEGPHGTTPW